ncbi:MAG: hypothetical protein AAFY28_15075, partial [Actinomycetota bacterium]
QDLDGVYSDTDPRNYQLSSYSYFILPTKVQGQFNEAKGRTLGEFAYYAMCQAQQQSASLGYSPIPINLVEAAFEQIRLIPGVEAQSVNVQDCNNPTFSSDGTNTLAQNAPQPQACDQQGGLQCPDGTGGLRNVPTAVSTPVGDAGGGATAGGTGGGVVVGGGGPGAANDASVAGGGDSGGAAPADAGGGQAVDPNAGQPSDGAGQQATNAPTGGGGTATNDDGAESDSSGSATGGGSATGSANTGSASTGSGSASTGAAPGAAESGSLAIDPDTGVAVAVDPVTGQQANAEQPVGAVATTTLDQDSGWGGTQTLALIVALLTLGLIVGPAVAWRHFSQRSPS